MSRQRSFAAQRGFTLVEAIMVIVIIGVLGAIVAIFIRAPIQGYVDTVARAEATDEADLALRRMARDIRLALPNSVRVNAEGTAIEFLLTTTGGRYLSAEDETQGDFLSFDDPADTTFTALGILAEAIVPGNAIVVFNMGVPGSDVWEAGATNMALVAEGAAADAVNPVIRLASNPFARTEPMPSPGQRFQVVSGPVQYRCQAENGGFVLRRFSNFPIAAAMLANPAGPQLRSAIIAARVVDCAGIFRSENVQARGAGLVLMSLALRLRGMGNDEAAVRLVHQVHVDNTP